MNWLLVFVPATLALHYLQPGAQTATFICACLAIVPLAGWLGRATEHLAERTGDGVGGLLNATFGNAAELIIAFAAMQRGLHDVVKASLTGSIVGNVLLVAGAAVVAGGLKFKVQKFKAAAASSLSSLMLLAAIGLVCPAAFHYLAGPTAVYQEARMSLVISSILLVAYALSLVFSLHTHKQLFSAEAAECAVVEEGVKHSWSLNKSLGILALSTALIAWVSEILVGSVEVAAHAFGMTNLFVGVIVVAIVGNAAEHSTAILVAMKNRMDLSFSIAIGSSIQIALFVAPLLVVLSQFVGPRPMDLVFTPAEVLAVLVAVVLITQVAGDGESNWLEGALLLSVYLILGIMFYFLPETAPVAVK